MKILFTLTPAFNPTSGGVQRITFNLGKYFSQHGHEVSYYSCSTEGHIRSEFGKLFFSELKGGMKERHNVTHLERILAEVKPDVVVNQMPYDAELRSTLFKAKRRHPFLLLGCLMNSLFNFKNNARDVSARTMSSPIFRLLDNPVGLQLIQWRHWLRHRCDLKKILNEHDYFVLVAPPSVEELEYFVGGYKSDKVVVIPNTIPSVSADVPAKEKIILHVGRLNIQQKRSDLLLDFWSKARHKLTGWEFVIVGDGPFRAQMERDTARLGLTGVSLQGFRDPEPFYRKAAIFLMPSAYEGFPNVLLEAQSMGVVPIAFNSYKALPWIVNDGKDAILIPPFDTTAMASEAVKLASDSSLLTNMQTAALLNAERFAIDRVALTWLELFNKKQST